MPRPYLPACLLVLSRISGDCCTCDNDDTGTDNCLDPNGYADCATPSPSFNDDDVDDDDDLDCGGISSNIGDGDCDDYNNNSECQWDGGK